MFNWRDIKNPAAGGAEVLTHEIAKRLVLHGHEFTLFASGFPNCKKQETIDGVRIIRDGGQFSVYWKAFMHYKKYFQGRKLHNRLYGLEIQANSIISSI